MFKKPEELERSSFDASLCLAANFRSVSYRVYNSDNADLGRNNIDVSFPIWSDKNDIKSFLVASMNLQRFLVSLVRVGGIVIVYPTAVSFQVLAAYDGFRDYEILDHRGEVTWQGCAMSTFPSYSTAPLTLHLDTKSPLRKSDYVAAEMFSEGMSIDSITYRFDKIAGDANSDFLKKGLNVIPAIYSLGCCVRKLLDINYDIDYALLRNTLQFHTNTFEKLKDPTVFTDPSKRRFLNSIYYGGRYELCCRDIRRVCNDFNEYLLSESYNGFMSYNRGSTDLSDNFWEL